MTETLERKTVNVDDFVKDKYRIFWNHTNKTKNGLDPHDQIPSVVRKIIFAAYKIGIKEHDEHKTLELIGETAKIHAHSSDSIEDSIKGLATRYKNGYANLLLDGIGNFGAAPGDTGAAGRYTSVSGSPLLSAIYKDIQFCPMNMDDTGIMQPDYISSPIPIGLISGASSIGVGRSNYLAERDAREIIEWIDKLRKGGFSRKYKSPTPTSVLGCEVYENPNNGYIYYYAKVHYGVNKDNYNKKGPYDVITALPPTKNAAHVIAKLKTFFPKISNQIQDASGKDEPVAILVPKGYLDKDEFTKYGMAWARKEQILIWDEDRQTIKWGTVHELAQSWFESREKIVIKRLEKDLQDDHKAVHRIDLIRIFAENKMINWKEQDVIDYFIKLDNENGEKDASLVLSQSARTFLPQNLGKNEIAKQKLLDQINFINNEIQNIGDLIIKEAYDIINAQEEFFAED